MNRPARPWLVLVAPLGLGLIILTIWYAVTATGFVSARDLPTPAAVAGELYASMFSPADIWPFVWNTVQEAVAGCLAGLVVALPLAVLIYRSRVVSAAVIPFLGATQAIPAIALANLLIIWVGYGLKSIATLCALMVFFPILVSSVVGFRHIDKDVLAAAQVDGAGSAAILLWIELPLALHSILAGVRNGFTLSITGAVVGEMVMGGRGLGSLLAVQRGSHNMPGMFATIIVLTALAAIIYSGVSLIERRWSDLTAPPPRGGR